MRNVLCSLLLFLTLTGISAGSSCVPKFHVQENNKSGWQGGDAAYSIPLGDGQDVWTFGDTLYGEKRVVNGNEPQMVHNSLGISTCDAHRHWHLHYVLRRNAAGEPQSYFSPADPGRWYWAMDGIAVKGELWITLLCLEKADNAQVAANFRTCGSDLAHITHLEREPRKLCAGESERGDG